ncbi:MAG: hypothetical protein NZ929_07075 [Aigarchaeota archaeon]|nr:hypothetical protein [Aigarchaeota archaeon]MCX8192472.1 hypothetical protein [Nitrososphaeria archaeon]MDW7985792.1 hypothetical protein [Nitrososphaerota archaeon]
MYSYEIIDLARKRDVLRLSIEVIRQNIHSSNLEISNKPSIGCRSSILLIHSRYVYTNIDGKKVFKMEKFMELEEFVKKNLREYSSRRSDAFWALLIGLTGVLGLIAINIPRLRDIKKRVKRMVDEDGDMVYVTMSSEGLMIPLLKISRSNYKIIIFSSLASALKIAGYYIIRLTYPDSYSSWEEALGLEQDPRIEVISEPDRLVS